MKTYSFNSFFIIFTMLLSSIGVGQITTTVSHDFDDGNLAPFQKCNVKSPNYVAVENGRVTTFWGEDGYDGTRDDKGAEFCGHDLGDWLTYKEGWCGVTIELGSDYPRDKNAGIAQIMGRFLDIGWSTWSGEISIENGDLVVQHRFGAGSSNTVHETVYPNFPYEEEVDVIIHFILSDQNTGEIEFWINGVSSYKATNINFGMGEFENDEQVPGLSRTIFKLGQYNYDDSNYDTGETRTVYYDNVTWYNGGAEGYSVVDPSDGSQGCRKITADIQVNGENYCESQGVNVKGATDGGSYIGDIQTNDYLSYGLFDFTTNTVNTIEASYGKSSTKYTDIEVRLDSPTGTLIGSIDASETTGGSQNWATNWTELDAVSGEHEVFLVFKGDAGVTLVNFNWFKIFSADICFSNASLKPYHIEAECFDDMEGIQTEASTEGTDNVGWIENGDWVMYAGINLTGMNSIKARVSGSTTGSIIEVHLGDVEGTLVGELTVSNTTGNQNWITDSVNILSTSGVHDVYLVFKGGEGYLFNINHFGFSEEQVVVTHTNQILNLNAMIFPNPASDVLNVNNQVGSIFRIYNTKGNIVLTEMIMSDHQLIDVREFPNGTYFISVTNNAGVGNRLFVKN